MMKDSSRITLEGINPFSGQGLGIILEKGIIQNKIDLGDQPKLKTRISPGLFDQQVNGFVGTLFTGGDFNLESCELMMSALFEKGVNRILPTIFTSSKESMVLALKKISEYREASPVLKAAWPGIHIEGPWISATDGPRGAHSKPDCRDPQWDEWCTFQEAANGLIIHVTLAPEREGAMQMIDKLTQEGVVVALGHHEASRDCMHKAFDLGATFITHLGNACHLDQHRSESYFWSILGDNRVKCSLVTDGFHLNSDQVRSYYHCKGTSGLLLTSDSSHVAGLKPGEYKKKWSGDYPRAIRTIGGKEFSYVGRFFYFSKRGG